MHIDSYKFGEIVIDGKKYTNDLKIFPQEIKTSWWRKSGHNLSRSDIDDIIAYKPDVLFIGTGANGRMRVGEDVKKYILDHGIGELYINKSSQAAKLYNQEQNNNKIAAFHLTC